MQGLYPTPSRKKKALGTSASTSLPNKFRGHERSVVTAEAEGIIEHDAQLLLPGHVRRVIEVAFRIGILEINRGRDNGIANGQRARGHLDRAGAA